jgi:hypothetical protein
VKAINFMKYHNKCNIIHNQISVEQDSEMLKVCNFHSLQFTSVSLISMATEIFIKFSRDVVRHHHQEERKRKWKVILYKVNIFPGNVHERNEWWGFVIAGVLINMKYIFSEWSYLIVKAFAAKYICTVLKLSRFFESFV